MRAERVNMPSRTLRITQMPSTVEGCNIPTEMEIVISYVDNGGNKTGKAIALDNVIIPAIVRLFNAEHESVKPQHVKDKELLSLVSLAVAVGRDPEACRRVLDISPDRLDTVSIQEVIRVALTEHYAEWVEKQLRKPQA